MGYYAKHPLYAHLTLEAKKICWGGTSKRKICYRCRECNSYTIRAHAVVPERGSRRR